MAEARRWSSWLRPIRRADSGKRLVRRFYDEIWNRAELSTIPEILTSDVTFRGSLGTVHTGHAEFADYVRGITEALGDYRCDIEELVAEGDRVVARMTFSGVHRAPLLDVPATGRQVTWSGAAFFTFSAGRVSDVWVLGDVDGLRRQLAAGPER
jgi:steroid delta-isomerase-like uncharacterized protein